MTKREQKVFVSGLIGNVKGEILGKMDKFPDDWDGIELRWYIRDYFGACVLTGNKKRERDYKNTVLVNGL